MIHEEGTGAIRSNDLAQQRWDLISGETLVTLKDAMNMSRYEEHPRYLVERATDRLYKFLGNVSGKRYHWLADGWACLATAIQLLDFEVGERQALRSVLQGTIEGHLPYYAIKRLALTCDEGAKKYGEHNWLHGFHVTGLANHGCKHLVRWTNGDTSEDHLGHTMWSFMAITHMLKYRPDMSTMLLGADYTLTAEMSPKKDREPMDLDHKSREAALVIEALQASERKLLVERQHYIDQQQKARG